MPVYSLAGRRPVLPPDGQYWIAPNAGLKLPNVEDFLHRSPVTDHTESEGSVRINGVPRLLVPEPE